MQRQWTKILAGRVSLADFVFAKEVRLGTYSARHGIVPPAAIVAGKAMASDPRMEPRYGERVPYVVVYGEPGASHQLKMLTGSLLLVRPEGSAMGLLVRVLQYHPGTVHVESNPP